MATFLRSQKYINFFNGYHLKTFQSALRLQSTVVEINGKTAEIDNTIFPKTIETNINILTRIKNKYLIKYYASYEDMLSLVDKMYNEDKNTKKQQFLHVIQDNDILMLIRCCGNKMKHEMPDERLKILDSMCQVLKSKGFKFNVNHYNALIEIYMENEKDFSPTTILSEMLSNNVQPNTLTYEYLLTYYCSKGNISDANKILHYFKENEIPINEKTFSSLIIGNAQANDMNGALNILSTMKIMGCIPSSNAYNALLYSYAKKGDIVNIMETLKSCERQNIPIDDINKIEIIYYLAINGHSDHIDKILSLISWDSSIFDMSHFITKLLHHKQIDVAFQLIQSASKADKMNFVLVHAVQFMRNIIKCELPAETVINYLNLIEQLKVPAYESTILHCFVKNKEHYCIPFFKAWQKMDASINEHFFWPLLSKHGSQKDGTIFNTIKAMKEDFNIEPSEETLLHFIIPFVNTFSAPDIMKTLIEDYKLSAENVINSLLQYYLSNRKLLSVEKCIKFSERYNVKYNSKNLYRLLQSLNNIKSKKILLFRDNIKLQNQLSKRNQNNEEKRMVAHLEHVDLGYKLRNYSQKGDILNAEITIKSLQNSYNYLLNFDKLLSYFDLLVKKDRIKDALQILADFTNKKKIMFIPSRELDQQCVNSLNLLAEKGSVDGVSKLLDTIKDYKIKITREMTQSLINVHLEKNNFEQVLEVVKNIEKEHGWLTSEIQIMEAFIKVEDANSLQHFTNFSNQHSGYIKTLLNLAIAFLRNNRLSQSKQVLQSGDFFIKGNNLRKIMHDLLLNNEYHMINDLLQITKGVNNIGRNVLYDVLLENYSASNKWTEGLELWNQIIEENTVPSSLFLLMMTELLKRNNQRLPDSMKQFLIDQQEEQQTNIYTKIVQTFIKENASPNQSYTNILLDNLIKIGDTKSIGLIDKYFNFIQRNEGNEYNIFESCENSNQVKNYLEYVDAAITVDNKKQIRNTSNVCNYKSLKYFINHPENFELFESLAIKIFANTELYKPILTVVAFHCYKNPSQALNIWNQYAPKLTTNAFSYSFIMESFLYADCLDILPQVEKSFEKINRFHYQKFYETLLQAFDSRGKYKKGLDILLNAEIKRRSKIKSNEESDYLEPRSLRVTA
ncbi:leucine-rich PPR motif-containing protein, mitochondrial [Leptopilina heterotoma]|uniref:leucine-rich PPR motif-containing protein, mitochondrial n=1 Tax=Leptopilina heterotoma TaxID=63436 RepID=UPI001CA857F7|nr:leucine-rich PPR motif-containing protein, mitochondrial [Leptopilina heterotoma]XP_043483859.1 leucine-rich PPR motif-containing protein, mitochondrial [Leptopilina heterotoma]